METKDPEAASSPHIHKSILEFHYWTDISVLLFESNRVVSVCISRVTCTEVQVCIESTLEDREVLMAWLVVLECRTGRVRVWISCVRSSVKNLVIVILELSHTAAVIEEAPTEKVDTTAVLATELLRTLNIGNVL